MFVLSKIFKETIPECISRLLGLSFILGSLFSFLAAITYSATDPSMNNANNNIVNNIMGSYGAYWADPLLQAIGYSYLYPAIVLSIIGYKLTTIRHISFTIARLSLLLFSIPIFALLLAFISSNKAIMTSWGGYVGTFLYNEGHLYTNTSTILIASLLTSIICIAITTTLTMKDWKKIIYIVIKSAAVAIGLIIWLGKTLYVTSQRLIIKLKGEGGEMPTMPKPEDIVEITSLKKAPKNKSTPAHVQSSLKIDSFSFDLPDVNLLTLNKQNTADKISEAALKQNSKLLQQVLQDFGIKGEIVKIHPGPVVTLYEFEPLAGVKTARIISLADDIARSMSAVSTRIATIPGRSTLGIELPNATREIVYLREIVESDEYYSTTAKLPIILGKNISGEHVVVDLSKMPHLLVAGTTGSGKSVAINTMILSLLYKYSPKECQLILIDPKMLELSVYDGIPHLISPVVTEPKKAVQALRWAVKEMEDRYRAMSTMGVRNIHGYNKLVENALKKGENLNKEVQTGFDKETGEPIFETIEIAKDPLPFLVVVVDEMADLMLVAGKEIEGSIQRLAQMARAAGIHIILATQRPSVDVITGVIKANFPTRISFQVTSKIDSRTILGEQGAEQLLGMGDMLYMSGGTGLSRVHGPFVSDAEVESVVNHLRSQAKPQYNAEVTEVEEDESPIVMNNGSPDEEDLYQQAIEIVRRDKRASTSYIQRCLRIGYNRAANLIEQMERDGIVSTPNHNGKREILEENE